MLTIKNEGITQRIFIRGNIVIIKKQVQSKASQGIAAKIVFKLRGPYRVLELASPGSYWILKLPFLEGLGMPGQQVNVSAAQMEKSCQHWFYISNWTVLIHALMESPLQCWLGMSAYGEYQQAPPRKSLLLYALKKCGTILSMSPSQNPRWKMPSRTSNPFIQLRSNRRWAGQPWHADNRRMEVTSKLSSSFTWQ
jgi:hypothetical protein